jgi:DNA topoisomerase II
MHAKEKMWVPEMIFGHLLTGSNFDDTTERVTGGRNGLGAKLANIFSLEFTIETASSKFGKKFKQTFRNNMTERTKPEITDLKKDEDWTRITFRPDLEKFGMDHLDEGTPPQFDF